ncbi:MAG: CHASE2 domain-containing protein [Leptolyngbya sp. SIO1E4]|nr:CHASE2 domain-containing protein [Leptolyngbya sp. SIO1E4]
MNRHVWKQIKHHAKYWREVVLPGAAIVALVVLIRLSGFLQTQEWETFDTFMRMRPPVTPEPRVVMVGIDEADLNRIGGYPVSDLTLAKAIDILERYSPRVIGLDLFRDLPIEPGHELLQQRFKTYDNIVGAEVALNQDDLLNIGGPPALTPERVGFVDVIVDADGKIRRSLLASRDWHGDLKYSLGLKLARVYLAGEDIAFSQGQLDPQPRSQTIRTVSQAADQTKIKSSDPIYFGTTIIPRFLANSGGYIRADAYGYQTLLNFCTSHTPFRSLSLSDVLEESFDSTWIRDRAILIGMTAASTKDIFLTAAVKSTQIHSALKSDISANQLIYGVEIIAHTSGQIIRAVLDKRAPLHVWPDLAEYAWIMAWGFLGITLGLIFQSPWHSLLSIGVASLGLLSLCYLLMMGYWWTPIVPTLLALLGAGLTTTFFDRDLKFEMEQRRRTIERTYEAVHNGPLQHLAAMLRNTPELTHSSEQLHTNLQTLNEELRSIYESMRRELLTRSDGFHLEGNLVLDLDAPITELLSRVYEHTLTRKLPGFATLQTYITSNFKPLKNCRLTLEQKRGLCRFLQEALCNVGKHSMNARRLDVICTQRAGWYSLRVIDNGTNTIDWDQPIVTGQGTQQALALARKLHGKFRRVANSPQGILCELTWPTSVKWPRRLWQFMPKLYEQLWVHRSQR